MNDGFRNVIREILFLVLNQSWCIEEFFNCSQNVRHSNSKPVGQLNSWANVSFHINKTISVSRWNMRKKMSELITHRKKELFHFISKLTELDLTRVKIIRHNYETVTNANICHGICVHVNSDKKSIETKKRW